MLEIEEAPGRVINIGGRWMRDVDRIIRPEKLDRMWKGYLCAMCEEPLREPFPEVCPLVGCGYEIKKNQTRDLEALYEGRDVEYEQIMKEPEPIEERVRKSGIWVPKSI